VLRTFSLTTTQKGGNKQQATGNGENADTLPYATYVIGSLPRVLALKTSTVQEANFCKN
jgi:hypothetical protein